MYLHLLSNLLHFEELEDLTLGVGKIRFCLEALCLNGGLVIGSCCHLLLLDTSKVGLLTIEHE